MEWQRETNDFHLHFRLITLSLAGPTILRCWICAPRQSGGIGNGLSTDGWHGYVKMKMKTLDAALRVQYRYASISKFSYVTCIMIHHMNHDGRR